jgi:ribosomal protein S18 acetylase RimI-like enzyme
LDCGIIYNLKLNEIEFCKSWSCQTINFNDSFRIIVNRDLKGDYFLNRVILTNGIEESKRRENGISSIISRLKKISKQQKIEVYVHINDDLLFLKSILAKNGLRKIDKLTGLVHVVKHQKCFLTDEYEKQKLLVYGESCKVVRTAHEFDKWLDVYSTSFGIDIENIATIRTSFQKENFKESKFILYEQKLNDNTNTHNLRPMGCCLLFPTNDILGLYCLGTVKRFRNKGIASSLIDFAITYAKMNGFDLIGLQALQSDHTTEFYQRRCFTTVYTHAIFSLPIS